MVEKTVRERAAAVALAALLSLGCLGAATVAAAVSAAADAQPAHAAQAGWRSTSGKWRYVQPSGRYATGWTKVGGKWYWFDSAGWMRTGWLNDGGKWYWFEGGGVMQTGWQRIGGVWYHFGASGAMDTGWKLIGGSWYWLGSSGGMATGWYKVAGTWYWSNSSGVMGASRWVGDYYLTASGAMATSQWIGSSYVGTDGKWIPNYRATPNPASDFEWKVGSKIPRLENGGGAMWDDVDCGYGVYITGYKGSGDSVVVPEQINGIDVVYADIVNVDNWDTDIRVIDVSHCSSLKCLETWEPESVNFGSIAEVKVVFFQSGINMSYVDLSRLSKLEYFVCQGDAPWSFDLNAKSLRVFCAWGLKALNLSGASNLRQVYAEYGSLTESTLNLSGCTSLESLSLGNNKISSFDPSGLPKLTSLWLVGNPLTNAAKTKLTAWGNQPGHELSL